MTQREEAANKNDKKKRRKDSTVRNYWADENVYLLSNDEQAGENKDHNNISSTKRRLDAKKEEGEEEEEDDDQIELVVQGRDICVSERLLCKHSKYFAHVFGSLPSDDDDDDGATTTTTTTVMVLRHGKLEGEEDIPVEKQEEPLSQISYATMRTILDFLETGVLKVGEQNVKHLLIASDLLAIGSVETACFNFLKSTLNESNCVRHFVLADAKRSWRNLSRHCANFIQLNFGRLMQLTQIYQQTSAKQFRDIISGESLNVQREEMVLESVLEWVGYDLESRSDQSCLQMLLEEVQWPLVRNKAVIKEVRTMQ